jgi:hypothetical protein
MKKTNKQIYTEAVEKMKKLVDDQTDREENHHIADEILVNFLIQLGYTELTDLFKQLYK